MTVAHLVAVMVAILSHATDSNNLGRTFYIQHTVCHVQTDYGTFIQGRCVTPAHRTIKINWRGTIHQQ